MNLIRLYSTNMVNATLKRFMPCVAFALMIASGALCVLALVTDFWVVRADGSHVGLWENCVYQSAVQICSTFKHADGVKAAIVFMIVSTGLFVGVYVYCIRQFIKQELQLKNIGGVLLFNAVAMTTSLVVFSSEGGLEGSYGWSYITAWVSVVTSIVAAGLTYVDFNYKSLY